MAMAIATPQELALISHNSYSEQNTPFRQQTGDRWMPKMTKWKSMILCGVVGVVLLVVGGGMYISISSIVVTDVIYYHGLAPAGTSVTFDVPILKDMSAPVYVYYRVDNFFQNHRRYVISRDERQLRGLGIGSPTTCAPLTAFSDLANNNDHSFTAPPNNSADATKTLYPCGLAAVTAFSDVWSACVLAGGAGSCTDPQWTSNGIDYPSDEKKYIADYTTDEGFDPASMTVSSPYISGRPDGPAGVSPRLLPTLGDPDLTVWMRMSPQSSFHKLYRVINNGGLSAGDVLRITTSNTWDVAPFSGKKGVVLSTSHFLGGRSLVMPIVYMAVGAACLFEAIFVFVLTRWCPGYAPTDGK